VDLAGEAVLAEIHRLQARLETHLSIVDVGRSFGHGGQLNDLDVVGVPLVPAQADPPLVVDPRTI
jgi:hypothetical protein